MPVTPISGASVYVDPEYLRCAYCGDKMKANDINRETLSRTAQAPQVWCVNAKCAAFNVVGDVCIDTYPGTQHRRRV